jgi:tetratricopeptide (TPR) repeat protein
MQHPKFEPAVAALGFALREQGRFDDAADVFRRAVSLAPDDATAVCGLARTLLEGGLAEKASAAARAYLRRRPGHAGALAVESLARMALGDTTGVDRLLDYERFLVREQLLVPDGFRDLATFNRALAGHAMAHPTLLRSPASHATLGGLHSGSLLMSPRGPVATFEQAVRAAVGNYWRSLSELRGHPFIGGRPGALFINIWCVVLALLCQFFAARSIIEVALTHVTT